MGVSVVAELTVMSMERFLQETEESFSQETNHIKTVKRVPYVVVHAEIKHKGNRIKSEYTFYDAEDMSFKDVRERIVKMQQDIIS